MPRTAEEHLAPPAVPDNCYVSSSVYTDPELYAEEEEKILRRTWKFVCHVSEIPDIGDYRTHVWTGVPLVTVRSPDNTARTFVNSCSHRGSRVVRYPAGNMKHMTCFFHLWEYDLYGNCIYQTRDEGYEAHGPTKEQAGLRAVRTNTFCGLVFMNFDGNAVPLREYIGETAEAFESIFGENDFEIIHYNQTHMKGNWKAWFLTNCDFYHEWGHQVNRSTNLTSPDYHDRPWRLNPTGGHGYTGRKLDNEPFVVQYKNYKGWKNRDGLVLKGLHPGELVLTDLFPNTSVFVRTTCVRINHSTPYGPDHTVMEERGLGIKGESEADRRQRAKEFTQVWGPFSRNAAEDVAFVEETHKCQEFGANKYDVLSRVEPLGDRWQRPQSDAYVRLFYEKWSEHMGRPANNPKNLMTAAE